MKIVLNTAMVMGLIKSWAKRNLASEGLEIVTYTWKDGSLEIELKEAELLDDEG